MGFQLARERKRARDMNCGKRERDSEPWAGNGKIKGRFQLRGHVRTRGHRREMEDISFISSKFASIPHLLRERHFKFVTYSSCSAFLSLKNVETIGLWSNQQTEGAK